MENLFQKLEDYLTRVTGRSVRLQERPDLNRRLPVYLGQRFRVFAGRLFDRERILVLRQGSKKPTPGELDKQLRQVEKSVGSDVVVVLDDLKAYERDRLVKRGIPFIVPERQIHLPQVFVDLRESTRSTFTSVDSRLEHLSAPAQMMLLFHLLKGPFDDWHLSLWAERLDYSPMTMSRAKAELVALELCDLEKRGRRVILRFREPKEKLWRDAGPFLSSPVADRVPARIGARSDLPLLESGVTALSRISALAPDILPVYALGVSDYLAAEEKGQLELAADADDADALLERWTYSPRPLSSNGITVDSLSLYLSMREEADERIQIALEDAMAVMEW